jgi:hypothetical protein
MSKFKIGDRVKDVTGHYKSYQLEESPIGTLKAYNGYTWTVEWDTDIGPDCWSDEQLELVSPSPVKARTVYEILPGIYGAIQVQKVYPDGINLYANPGRWSAEDITEAISTLTAIRDALQDQDQ